MTPEAQARMALQALRADWLRTAPSALGVIIGIALLVALSSIRAGARAAQDADLERLGANMIILDGESVVPPDGIESPTDGTLTPGDLDAVADLSGVTAVAPRQNADGLVVSAGRVRANPFVSGITPLYQQIHNYTAAQGRLLSAEDGRLGNQVIVLGEGPARRLFPDSSPIGRSVRVLDREFIVVGVFARKGNLGGENLDNQAFVALTVSKHVFLGGEKVCSASVQVANQEIVPKVMHAIDDLLTERHRILAGRGADFGTEDQGQTITTAKTATATVERLTLVLAAIALIVGCIRIRNLMMVSVTERTREIGIRKVVGAEPGQLRAQFLTEACALCAAAGLLGVVVGVGTARLTSDLLGWQTHTDPVAIILVMSIALALGVVSGYYPARRAARIPATVAMRAE